MMLIRRFMNWLGVATYWFIFILALPIFFIGNVIRICGQILLTIGHFILLNPNTAKEAFRNIFHNYIDISDL